MDVLGAKTLGIDNCVGLMGTEMTDDHIKLAKKCNCSISLCLDNDQAGKNGMLKIIPKLFSEGIEVNVVDLSKLGDFKDLGEAAISLKYKSDIENAKVSGFSFLLSQKYFNDKNYSVTNIKNQYEELKYDKVLKDTADFSLYLEYLEEKTNFTKDELNDIIFPKSIDEKYLSPLEKFKNKLLIETLSSSIMQYLMDKNDKVIMNYYNLHKEELFQEVVKEFNRNPENYMDATSIDINCSLLLKTLLDKDEEYQRYDFLNRFQYSHLFKKTYVKNDKGCAKLKLNKEQKTLVIKQYDNTLSEQEKLNLEDVSEMFIINKTNEIDAILPEITDPLIKETIKERMSISSCMQYFKFSTIFDKSMINYMDPSLLNTKGDGYKTILLVNNLNGMLNLSRENLDLEAIKPKEESIPQVEKQVQKDVIKEIHEVEEKKIVKQNIEKDEFFGLPVKKSIEKEHILVSKDQVLHYSEKGFFIKTADPNISIFAPIRLCSWKDENFTHLAITLGRKIFSKQTALSKYENNTFSALLSKEELECITKVINPSTKSMLSIPIDMSTSNDYGNCIHLPGNVNGIDGYFYISKSNINSGAIYGKDYFTFSFYDMDDKLITKIKLSDMQSHIKDGQSQEQVIDEREVF